MAMMDAAEADRLVAEVQDGRKEAFRALFLAFERPVRIHLSARAPSAEVVDEVLQATFITAYERIRAYERRGTFLFWLKGIARNRLLKELQERARHAHHGGDALEALLAQTAAEDLDADDGAVDGAALQRCLGRVTPRLRELLHQRYVERRAVKDLAAELSRTETWVSVTLHRARAFLRDCLSHREAT
jgi:RNA polymerase sigma-70 factor (ECF subfamily)